MPYKVDVSHGASTSVRFDRVISYAEGGVEVLENHDAESRLEYVVLNINETKGESVLRLIRLASIPVLRSAGISIL